MSNTIDNKVVSMEFDNSRFESNVSTSMSTLDKLKKALKFDGASKGIEEISEKASRFNFNPITSAVDGAREKFSALQVIAVTALQNITNSVINTGKQLISSLAIDPIKDGFHEYELKMGSIQTIMNSSGASLEKVNAYLAELNTYSDKTIYSFSDMTESIGKFTNAGVSLDKAVLAIKGISNEAAVSGANAQQASHAMYNFAQALSSGSVRLQDWKSIENANMATVEFKQTLIDSAVALGTVTKEGDRYKSTTKDLNGHVSDLFDATMGFNDALSSQWMTTDVLVDALSKYSDETTEFGKRAYAAASDVKTFSQLMDTLKESVGSGWAETWEIVFGDFEEAKSLWTQMNDVFSEIIQKSSDARNSLLKGGLGSGWKNLVDGYIPDANKFLDTVKKVAKENNVSVDSMVKEYGSFEASLKSGWLNKDILTKSIKEITKGTENMSVAQLVAAGRSQQEAEQIFKLNQALKDGSFNVDEWVDSLKKISGRENLVKSLMNSFEALRSVISPIGSALKEVFPPITGDMIYELTDRIKNFTDKLKLTGTESDNLKNTFKGVFSFVSLLGKGFGAVCKVLSPLLQLIRPIVNLFLSFTATIGKFITNLNNSIGGLKSFNDGVTSVKQKVQSLVDSIKNLPQVFSDSKNVVTTFFKEMSYGFDTIAENIGKIFQDSDPLEHLLNMFAKSFGPAFEAFGEVIRRISSLIGDSIGNIIDRFSLTKGLGIIFTAFGGLSFSTILQNVQNFAQKIDGLGDTLNGIVDTIKSNIGTSSGGFFESLRESLSTFTSGVKVGKLLAIATAVGILSVSLTALSEIPMDKVAVGLAGLGGIILELAAGIKLLSKIPEEDAEALGEVGETLGEFASAVATMASALSLLAELDWNQMTVGLTGIAGISAVIVASMWGLSKLEKPMTKGVASMVIFTFAVKLMATTVKSLSSLNWEELGKGVAGIAGIAAVLVASMRLMAGAKGSILKGSIAMSGIAVAMNIILPVLKQLSAMNPEQLVQGLLSMGVALSEIALTLKLMGSSGTVSGAISLIAMAGALTIIIPVLQTLASMSLKELGKGLGGLAGLLLELSIALKMMSGSFGGAASVAAVGVALNLLIPPIKMFASMNGESIGKSLIAVGSALAIMAVGLRAMQGTLSGAAAMVVAAAAFNLLAMSVSVISGVSWEGIIKSIVTLSATLLLLGVAAKVIAPMSMSLIILSGTIAVFGAALGVLGTGVSLMAVAFNEFGDAVISKAKDVLKAIIELGPPLIEVGKTIVLGICDVLLSALPKITEIIIELVKSAIKIIVTLAPDIAEGIVKVIDEVLKTLVKYAPSICDSIMDFIVIVLHSLSTHIPQIVKEVSNILGEIFGAIMDQLGKFGTKNIEQFLTNVGFLAAITAALAAVGPLVPAAMVSVLKLSLLVGELGLVLAAFGAINQIPGVQNMIADGGNLLQTIGTGIGQFVGGIVGGFAKGMFDQLPAIGKDLSDFIKNLEPFMNASGSIDPNLCTSIETLVKAVTMLTERNIMEGLTNWFTGGQSIDKFGSDLVSIGTYLKLYSDQVSGIDTETIARSSTALNQLMTGMDSLPTTGGVLGWFNGETDVQAFGENLVKFGHSLKAYAESVAGLDAEVVVNSANAAQAMVQLATEVPNSGGVVGWFMGENDMGSFGDNLVRFGTAMKSYADSVTGIDPNVVINSANAARAIVELSNNLPNSGGVAGWFMGENDMGTFGDQLVKFGSAISSYSAQLAGIDLGAMSSATNEFKRLVDLATGCVSIDFSGMNNFSISLQSLANTGISNFIATFADAQSRVREAGGRLLTETVEGFRSRLSKLADAGREAGKKVVDAINNSKSKFRSAGQNVTTAIADGMKSNSSRVTSAARNLLNSIRGQFNGSSTLLYSAGANIAQGLASGINANAWRAISAARSMANAVAEASRKALVIRSPSRVFFKFGRFIDQGLENGINTYIPNVVEASENLARKTIAAVDKAISTTNNLIEDNNGLIPTITPVVDLSEVTSAAGKLSTLFDKEPELTARLSSIANGVSNKEDKTLNITVDNTDVVESINELQNEFAELKSSFTNMRVYLDSGALVGQLIDKIDTQLGSKQTLKLRGV